MEQIEWIGDVIAFCMCAVTIFVVFRQRANYRHEVGRQGGPERIKDFKEQLGGVFLVPPRTEILGKAESTGRLRPERMPDGNVRTHRTDDDKIKSPGEGEESRLELRGDTAGNGYDAIIGLADKGMDREAIYRQTGISKGEIDLVLKLKGLRRQVNRTD